MRDVAFISIVSLVTFWLAGKLFIPFTGAVQAMIIGLLVAGKIIDELNELKRKC